MVVLVGADDEERVRWSDPVAGEPCEEVGEGVVVRTEVGLVGRIAWAELDPGLEVLMRVCEIGERDRHSVLEHGGGVPERPRGGHRAEPREAGDRVSFNVAYDTTATDLGGDVLVAEKPVEARVAPRLGRKPV